MLKAIQAGDESPLREIYTKYRDPFIAWSIRKYNISVEDAKDLFQHTVIIFYDQVRQGKITALRSSLKTYLFGIGRNKARELLRQKQKENSSAPELLIRLIAEENAVEDKIEYEKRLTKVYHALNALGDPCNSLIKLFYLEQMSMEGICSLLGYNNTDTAKNQKYKCLKRLKKRLIEGEGIMKREEV